MKNIITNILKKYFSSYQDLKKSSWQGIFLNFIESLCVGVYYFLPLYFVNELNFSLQNASIMISVYGVGTILGGFFGGKLSDKVTPGVIVTNSLFLQVISLLFLLNVHSMSYIIIDMFLMGVASYSFITSNYLWVLSLSGKDENVKLKAINILNMASNLGTGLSALIISMISLYRFHDILAVSGILLLISAIYFLSLNKSVKQHVNKSIEKDDSLNKMESIFFTQKTFYLILICLFFAGLIIFQLNTTYSLYIKQSFPQYDMKAVGFLFFLNCFLIVFFQDPFVHLFRNQNKIIMTGVGSFMLGFGMFMLAFSSTFFLVILSCIIYTMGEMLFFSLAQYICYHSGSQQDRGKNLGIYRTVYACSRVLGPVGGGVVFSYLGGHLLWLVCGMIGVLTLLACCYYPSLRTSQLKV